MRYPENQFGPVMALAVDRNNDLWINTAAGGTYLSRTANGTAKMMHWAESLGFSERWRGMTMGNVWFGFSNYLLKWDGSEFQRFSFPNGRRGVSETTMFGAR